MQNLCYQVYKSISDPISILLKIKKHFEFSSVLLLFAYCERDVRI